MRNTTYGVRVRTTKKAVRRECYGVLQTPTVRHLQTPYFLIFYFYSKITIKTGEKEEIVIQKVFTEM